MGIRSVGWGGCWGEIGLLSSKTFLMSVCVFQALKTSKEERGRRGDSVPSYPMTLFDQSLFAFHHHHHQERSGPFSPPERTHSENIFRYGRPV